MFEPVAEAPCREVRCDATATIVYSHIVIAGHVEPVKTIALLSPRLVVICLVGYIATLVVGVMKHRLQAVAVCLLQIQEGTL